MLIDEWLQADERATHAAPALLKDFKSDLPDFLQEVGAMFAGVVGAIDTTEEKEYDEGLEAVRSRLGISVEELIARMKGNDTDPAVVEAREHWHVATRRQASKIVAHLCWRSFRWAMTDLYRLKLTAVMGHMRVETEAVALIHLFRTDPAFADRWLSKSEDGRRFFRDSQGKVKSILTDHELLNVYDFGSSMAQHVRMMSAVRGLDVDSRATHVGFELRDQEVDANDPFSLHNAIAYFVRTQIRVLKALQKAFPALHEEAVQDRTAAASRYVDDLYWLLNRRYPEQIREMYVSEPGPTGPAA